MLLLEDITFRGGIRGRERERRWGYKLLWWREERGEQRWEEEETKIGVKGCFSLSRAALSRSSNSLRSRLSISSCQPGYCPLLDAVYWRSLLTARSTSERDDSLNKKVIWPYRSSLIVPSQRSTIEQPISCEESVHGGKTRVPKDKRIEPTVNVIIIERWWAAEGKVGGQRRREGTGLEWALHPLLSSSPLLKCKPTKPPHQYHSSATASCVCVFSFLNASPFIDRERGRERERERESTSDRVCSSCGARVVCVSESVCVTLNRGRGGIVREGEWERKREREREQTGTEGKSRGQQIWFLLGCEDQTQRDGFLLDVRNCCLTHTHTKQKRSVTIPSFSTNFRCVPLILQGFILLLNDLFWNCYWERWSWDGFKSDLWEGGGVGGGSLLDTKSYLPTSNLSFFNFLFIAACRALVREQTQSQRGEGDEVLKMKPKRLKKKKKKVGRRRRRKKGIHAIHQLGK